MGKFRAIGFVLSVALGASPISARGVQSSADLAADLFMEACVSSRGDPGAVAATAKVLDLDQLAGDQAAPFLAGVAGVAWAPSYRERQFVVTATVPDTCTVFVHGVPATDLRNAFESWLPAPTSPLSYRKVSETMHEGVTTTLYAVMQSNRPYALWVLMTSDRPDGQGLMSIHALTARSGQPSPPPSTAQEPVSGNQRVDVYKPQSRDRSR